MVVLSRLQSVWRFLVENIIWEFLKWLVFGKLGPLVIGVILALIARLSELPWAYIALWFIAGVTLWTWAINGLTWRTEIQRSASREQAIQRRIPAVLDEQQKEPMRSLYLAHWEPAFIQASKMLQNIINELSRKTDSASQNLAELVGKIRSNAIDFSVLLEVLLDSKDTTGEKAQEAVGAFFGHYQSIIEWVYRGAQVLGSGDLNRYKDYQHWKEIDGRFLAQLRELIARTGFEKLRDKVRDVGWGDNFRMP